MFTVSPLLAQEKSFPPFYIYKIIPGDQLASFDFTDLDGKIWTNRQYLFRPLIFITGNWKLRHDVRKWANFPSLKYNPVADVIWLFNPASTEFADHNQRLIDAFSRISPPVPTIIDRHSLIGRSLKINYHIPTIIGITRTNRFAFAFASPMSDQGKEELTSLIESKLLPRQANFTGLFFAFFCVRLAPNFTTNQTNIRRLSL